MGDTALLPQTTRGLEDYAADLTRVELTGADHWLHHQKPDAVAEAILGWI
jgi:pimeloyl-ACP methyl ester carboxylesterase